MSPTRLPAERVGDALRSLGEHTEPPCPQSVRDFVVRLPSWVESYGVARLSESWLLLMGSAEDEDAPRDTRDSAFSMRQAVLDLPEGRYTIEAFDVDSGAVLSREAAASPPLVVGVPRRGTTVLLRIEAVIGSPRKT